VIFVGVDWAEVHHDICVMDQDGAVLGRRRLPDSVAGIGELHELVAEHAQDDEEVVVGIEIDRGLVVTALVAAGYQLYAINPMASSRYRGHAVSGAKSDPGDAKVLADLVRTDRHNHRPVAGDTNLVEGVKLLARVHQSAIWGRRRQLNALRSALREYYPAALVAFGTDLAHGDATQVLALAPTPELGRTLSRSKIASALQRGGRTRNVERRTEEIQAALRAEYLEAPPTIAGAYGTITRSALRLAETYTAEIARLEEALSEHFEQQADAKVVLSLPGLGTVLGARVLGESVMTGVVSPVPTLARTTPARRPSPRRRDTAGWCWPASPATAAWVTLRPVGVLCAHPLTGGPPLLRRTASAGQDLSPSTPTAGQPPRRHPPRLPRGEHPL